MANALHYSTGSIDRFYWLRIIARGTRLLSVSDTLPECYLSLDGNVDDFSGQLSPVYRILDMLAVERQR